MKPVYAFLLGCLITAAVFGIYIGGLKSRLGSTQNQGQFVVQQQARELQQVKEQRDTCQAKFNRSTILYTQQKSILGSPFGDPKKVWVIAVDVEPEYVGSEVGLYSHYDSKSQVETVKFPAKR